MSTEEKTQTVDVVDLFKDNPDFHIEANEAFSEACHAACDRAGKATITFSFKLVPSFGGKIPRIDIEPSDPKIRKPKSEWASKPYFSSSGGAVIKDDPNQSSFEFEDEEDAAKVISI